MRKKEGVRARTAGIVAAAVVAVLSVSATVAAAVSDYDTNVDGRIQRDEVIAAIDDYLDGGSITRAEVIEVIEHYLSDIPVEAATPPPDRVTTISSGGFHVCGLKADGSAVAGAATASDRRRRLPVSGLYLSAAAWSIRARCGPMGGLSAGAPTVTGGPHRLRESASYRSAAEVGTPADCALTGGPSAGGGRTT